MADQHDKTLDCKVCGEERVFRFGVNGDAFHSAGWKIIPDGVLCPKCARPLASEPPRPDHKYLRWVFDVLDQKVLARVDVYSVLAAFRVGCPARAHAVKKLLCAGLRGSKGELQDLEEARIALDRAIQMLKVGQIKGVQDGA